MADHEGLLQGGLTELGVRRPWLVLVVNLLIAIGREALDCSRKKA